jgi:hypothetical protein
VRVVSVFRAGRHGTWQRSVADLDLRSMPRWTDVMVEGARDSSLVSKLGIEQLSGESYLLDPVGKVIHSAMGSATMLAAIEDSIADLAAKP